MMLTRPAQPSTPRSGRSTYDAPDSQKMTTRDALDHTELFAVRNTVRTVSACPIPERELDYGLPDQGMLRNGMLGVQGFHLLGGW